MRIYLENIIKSYDGRTVLDVDKLCMERGSMSGIIGPNGAGKSTLLSITAGLMKSDAGKLYYGNEMQEQTPYRDMTLVFQSPYLIRTTVWNNIAYPLKLRGWNSSEIEARVTELAAELHLTGFLKQKSWKLSGGELQKAALARAISFHPKLLMLDEPTANADPATTAEMEAILSKINQNEGTTVLLITHNLVQARRLCRDIIFINQGKVIEQGAADALLKNPRHELTKRFVAGELLTE